MPVVMEDRARMADSKRSVDGAALRERALAACALLVVQVTAAGYNVLTAEALKSGVDPLVFSFMRDALAYPLLYSSFSSRGCLMFVLAR